MTSVTTYFKTLKQEIVCLLSQLLSQLPHPAVLHQIFNVSTLLLDDAINGDVADQWHYQ